MDFIFYFIVLVLYETVNFVTGIKFSAESFNEISLLANEGKVRLESLTEKSNVPQYGTCWKSAISNLQIGCKFLSENVQSDLALKFTDCFLQMSGHEPMACEIPKRECLQNLSDRAFNAYTEFYTHTQSICYFLQSQVWHEEAEKTIDKLSSTSYHVSQKLEEAEKTQEKLLEQQRQSLFLQMDLIDNSQNVASALQSSQEKINTIMNDFQSSTLEQKQLLVEVFENLLLFRSWVMNELSWFSSTVFFTTATILGFLFTSISRTNGARIYIFIIFSLNYLFERLLNSREITNPNNATLSTEALNSFIWMCRKFCICLSIIIILYIALNYYDYNILNYQLLVEIKNQNMKILNELASETNHKLNNSKISLYKRNNLYNNLIGGDRLDGGSTNTKTPLRQEETTAYTEVYSRNTSYSSPPKDPIVLPSQNHVDESDAKNLDNVSVKSEKLSYSEVRVKYNLRSSRVWRKEA